jgi:hypothetical protein
MITSFINHIGKANSLTFWALPPCSRLSYFFFVGRINTSRVGGQQQMKIVSTIQCSQDSNKRFQGRFPLCFKTFKRPQWHVSQGCKRFLGVVTVLSQLPNSRYEQLANLLVRPILERIKFLFWCHALNNRPHMTL